LLGWLSGLLEFVMVRKVVVMEDEKVGYGGEEIDHVRERKGKE
jgi:hypothetical protein